ncbi:unnamed protein product [Blepharisma stoltei]|uniref:Guanylate cyclase domain-containing protein n=1 Tax=Blepharisma stoltei TaxID=1481888 RepID=A0AAU9K179_9CILI|nr:unnamed protein product [Blepharisma stoltei]
MILPINFPQSSINCGQEDGQSFLPMENNTTIFNLDTSESPIVIPQIQPKRRLQEKMISFLESNSLLAFMTIITIYALFGDDIRLAAFSKDEDDIFFSLATVCFALFSIELILSCLYKPDYIFSMYFLLDLLSTLSLITDIGWIYESMIGVDSNSSKNASNIQNASKISRAGTRTTKYVRIIRLVRLLRVVKLYKNANVAITKTGTEEIEAAVIPKESQVGKRFSDLTIKRVIIIVLLMLFILPFFDTDFYDSDPTSWNFGLDEVIAFEGRRGFWGVVEEYWNYHVNDTRPIIYLYLEFSNGTNYTREGDADYTNLRYNEFETSGNDSSFSVFDIRADTRLAAILNICQTIFICFVFTVAVFYFTKDTTNLVIAPIEKMVQRVTEIAKNPISAYKKKDIDKGKKKKFCFCFSLGTGENGKYEAALLEDTMNKIGALLALGFGEAGASIISSNMETGDLQFKKGSRIVAIFGFCDIRNFIDTTEVLQEKAMIFVNEIAKIVHRTIDVYQGAANKNIGDSFLIVWKFKPKDFSISSNNIIRRNSSSRKAEYLPDLALLAFLKILAKINKDSSILKYRQSEGLNKKMKNFEVKMGFGLNFGWAIEGAIGSKFKIDASYLSPHVNLASRLEAATKQYGVPLILSGALYDLFSPAVKAFCRHIDTVTIKGSNTPIRIYTSDCDFSELSPSRSKPKTKENSNLKRKALKKKLEDRSWNPIDSFSESRSVTIMRRSFKKEFFETFESGFTLYLAKDWRSAYGKFEKCLKMKPKDGPSLRLLEFISGNGFQPSPSWEGYRALNDK